MSVCHCHCVRFSRNSIGIIATFTGNRRHITELSSQRQISWVSILSSMKLQTRIVSRSTWKIFNFAIFWLRQVSSFRETLSIGIDWVTSPIKSNSSVLQLHARLVNTKFQFQQRIDWTCEGRRQELEQLKIKGRKYALQHPLDKLSIRLNCDWIVKKSLVWCDQTSDGKGNKSFENDFVLFCRCCSLYFVILSHCRCETTDFFFRLRFRCVDRLAVTKQTAMDCMHDSKMFNILKRKPHVWRRYPHYVIYSFVSLLATRGRQCQRTGERGREERVNVKKFA